MFKVAFGIAAAAALATATPVAAAIVLNVGPGVLQPEENVLFNNGPTPGPVIEGVTNQTATAVAVEAGEPLKAFGGQARVRPADLSFNTLFNFRGVDGQLAGFDLVDGGLAFTETEFRVFGGTATQLTLTFVDLAGEVFQQTFDIPKSGFFNARAIDGQFIDYFSIAANGTLADIRQVRIGGIAAVIPEPAAWAMMLLGFGAAGAVLRTRRRLALA